MIVLVIAVAALSLVVAGCGGGDSLAGEAEGAMADAIESYSTFEGYELVGGIECVGDEPDDLDESTRYVCRFNLVRGGVELPQTRIVVCNPKSRVCAWADV